MALFGTGVHFEQRNGGFREGTEVGLRTVGLGLTGLDINDNGTRLVVNGSALSYSNNKGEFLLSRHDDGLDLLLGDGKNEFGVNTENNKARMYVVSPKGEFDITADETGARIQRYAKEQRGAVATTNAISPSAIPSSSRQTFTVTITSSANPSSPFQTVTFTATVTSSTGAHATGTVTFTAGTTTLGAVPLNRNIASTSTATLPFGSTTVTATYKASKASEDFPASSASLTQTVQ